jgi:hypothetical protein
LFRSVSDFEFAQTMSPYRDKRKLSVMSFFFVRRYHMQEHIQVIKMQNTAVRPCFFTALTIALR